MSSYTSIRDVGQMQSTWLSWKLFAILLEENGDKDKRNRLSKGTLFLQTTTTAKAIDRLKITVRSYSLSHVSQQHRNNINWKSIELGISCDVWLLAVIRSIDGISSDLLFFAAEALLTHGSFRSRQHEASSDGHRYNQQSHRSRGLETRNRNILYFRNPSLLHWMLREFS